RCPTSTSRCASHARASSSRDAPSRSIASCSGSPRSKSVARCPVDAAAHRLPHYVHRNNEDAGVAYPLRVALISEHASPLATIGGVDAGGQNVYVAHVARQLAKAGHRVDVLTRRDSPELPTVVDWLPGVRVLHLDAGPPSAVPKEELLQHM